MRITTLILLCVSLLPLGAADYPMQGPSAQGAQVTIDPVSSKKPVLVVFWASWCGVCVREMPSVLNVHNRAGEKLQIVSCSIDEDAEAAKAAVTKHHLTYPVILDGQMAIADKFGVEATPTMVLIGTDGKEIARGRSLAQLRKPLAALGVEGL